MRKIVLIVLCGLLPLLWTTTGLASPSSQLVTEGRGLFFNHGDPKVRLLDETLAKFQAAVAADPTNQEAYFFLALTKGAAAFAKQGNGAGQMTMRGLIESLGGGWNGLATLAVTGMAPLASLTAGDLPLSEPRYDRRHLPPMAMPSGASLQGYLGGQLAAVLDAVAADLAKIDSSFNILISTEETGLGESVAIDYSDVLVIRSMLYTMKFLVSLANAWDMNIDLRQLILQSMAGPVQVQRDLLDRYPQFLHLKSGGGTALAAARAALISAISSFVEGNTVLQASPDGQGTRLFSFGSPEEAAAAQTAANQLAAIRDSLTDNTSALLNNDPADPLAELDLNYLFGNTGKTALDPRAYLPDFNEQNHILPDSTILTPILGGIFPRLATTPDPFVAAFGDGRIAKVPDPPMMGGATAGNGRATIGFAPPLSDGGSTITGYVVTSAPDGKTASGTAGPPLTVTGLTNGRAYTFTVRAINEVGNSAPSAASNGVTPGTVPSAPTMGRVVAGDGQATVSFTPPRANGGRPITGYTVTASPGGSTKIGNSSPLTLTGLTNGVAYTFTVTASNGTGTSAASSASRAVMPAGLPGPPRNVTASAGRGKVTVAFEAPTSNGGLPISKYIVTTSPGSKTGSGNGSPLTVTGLRRGITYTFTVRAMNAKGIGAASGPSNGVKPLP